MKIRIGLKHPVAVYSSELRVPMSELKVVVDIECGCRMLDSACKQSLASFLTNCNQKVCVLIRLEIGKKGKRGF